MDFLRKKIIAIAFIMIAMTSAYAQTSEQLLKAFKESYTAELTGDYNGAIAALNKVYKSDNYEINLRIGWLQYEAKNYITSMEYYQKAIDLKKFSVEARLGYITPANEAKQYDKAYQKYEEILKIDPYNSVANYWVGYNYYLVKKYDVAVKYFELIVNMYPFDYDANNMLGWTYLNLGKTGEAKILFEKALLNRPTDASAKEGLGKCK